MWDQIVRDFLMLFATIDPLGTLAIFVPLTAGVAPELRPRVALRAVVVGGAILLGFLVAGQVVLSGLGVRLVSFQLAGGVVLFLFAIQMIFGTGSAVDPPSEADHDVAIFPLALPSIASPGSILAVVILTDNHRTSLDQQALTAAVLVAILALTLGVLLGANRIHRALGRAGASIVTRVGGLVLSALAAEQIVSGLLQLLAEVRAG